MKVIRPGNAAAFQSTRPLRGATPRDACLLALTRYFNPRAPCGARRAFLSVVSDAVVISIHAPLAGRDSAAREGGRRSVYFNPRAPCGARQLHTRSNPHHVDFNPRAPCGARRLIGGQKKHENRKFQSTRPLRGATLTNKEENKKWKISIHAPLAGRDCS